MKPDIDKLAKQHGFELERTKKHRVYKSADGRTLVTPSTPSDKDWEQNALTDFARVVGVPRKELLHIDRKPLRALRPHAKLPAHDNPYVLTKAQAAQFGELMSFLGSHMRRARNSMAFLHDYARTPQEHFDATKEAVMQMARNLRRDLRHAPAPYECDAVFCIKIGGEGDGYDCVEMRLPVADGDTFVFYLDPASFEIRCEVPWTLEDGRSYEPVAYAGDWFDKAG
jgi:hypothetical protein